MLNRRKRKISYSKQKHQKDVWDKADIIAKFTSSIVIAGIGLYLTSTIQSAQIEFSKVASASDIRVKQATLTGQLIQHLTSSDSNRREIALIALRGNLPDPEYNDILKAVALKDRNSSVRLTAIEQLGNSKEASSIPTLNDIIQKENTAPAEKREAYKSTLKISLNAGKADWSFIGAGEMAYEGPKYDGGYFTYNLIQYYTQNKSNNITLNGLSNYLKNSEKIDLSGTVVPEDDQKQNAVFVTKNNFNWNNSIRPDNQTKYFLIGISEYPKLYILKYATRDAIKFKQMLQHEYDIKEDNITLLENPTKTELLDQLTLIKKNLAKDSKVVLYYSGTSALSENSGLTLLTKDSDFTGQGISLANLVESFQNIKGIMVLWDSSTYNFGQSH